MPDNTEIDQSENQTMIDMAKANAKRLKENVMGTEEQNKAAAERQKKAAEKYPDSAEAKAKALMGFGLGVLKNAKEPIKKAKGRSEEHTSELQSH